MKTHWNKIRLFIILERVPYWNLQAYRQKCQSELNPSLLNKLKEKKNDKRGMYGTPLLSYASLFIYKYIYIYILAKLRGADIKPSY